jgi:hypothetical protein
MAATTAAAAAAAAAAVPPQCSASVRSPFLRYNYNFMAQQLACSEQQLMQQQHHGVHSGPHQLVRLPHRQQQLQLTCQGHPQGHPPHRLWLLLLLLVLVIKRP